MAIPDKLPGYAIWLLPAGEAARQIALSIAGLAERFRTPGFEPHLTLASGNDSERLISRCRELADSSPALHVQPCGLGSSSDFFRHLHIQIAPCESLRQLHHAATTDAPHPRPYAPHISLLYRDDLLRDTHNYAAHTDHLQLAPIHLKQLALVQLDPRVERWRTMARWPLASR